MSDKTILIIGAGNVVENRLIPSLLWLGVSPYSIRIYGLDSDKNSIDVNIKNKITRIPVAKHSLENLPKIIDKTEGIPWLATPPFKARQNFLEAFSEREFIVEKPLGLTKDDYLFLEENSFLLKNCFVLSYYFMEKFAPFFWLLGSLMPPRLLVEKNMVKKSSKIPISPINYNDIETVEVSLSEPYARKIGDTVSPWQKDFGLLEFAVHAGSVLSNLGLEYKLTHRSNTCIKYLSSKGGAVAKRPYTINRSIVVKTRQGLYAADGVSRSANFTNGTTNITYSIKSSAPLYASVVSYALDYIDKKSSIPNGDLVAQLTALKNSTVV